MVDEFGQLSKDREEPTDNLITWVFDEGSFRPAAKITATKHYSIITDYLGTPKEAYDWWANKVWAIELEAYGKVKSCQSWLDVPAEAGFIPFRFQGQYHDVETGLYYNRFRYYSPEEGMYVTAQDPIRLMGGSRLYGYVHDPNAWVDMLGLYWEWVNPSSLNFSQAYVSENVNEYVEDMKNGNWDWNRSGPLKVAEIEGQLVSLDNRRLLAAQEAGLDSVPIIKVNLNDPLPYPATGGTYGSNLGKKLNSKPKGSNVPRIKLPATGTSEKPKIVPKCK